MLNAPTRNELAALPRLFSTKAIPAGEKVIHMRFFLPGYAWYIVEFNGSDTFMGFIVMDGDTANAEWAYFTFSELQGINRNGVGIKRDSDWKPTAAKDIGIGV